MVKNLFRSLAVLPVLVALLVLGATPAAAADLRSGDAVVIASGDEVNDDLYIAANRITINGTVNGDVLCAGETIIVNGKINGSIIAIGSNVSVGGEVTRTVRVAGANVDISGVVGEDVLIAGDRVDLAAAADVGRDLLFAARQVNVDNPIGGFIKGFASRVDINNLVGGDVEVGITNLTLSSTAKIQGDLTYTSDKDAVIHAGAQISGTTTHNLPQPKPAESPLFDFGVWSKILAFLTTLVTGCLIIVIAPRQAAAVAEAITKKPLTSLGWGAVILFATPIAVLFTFVTIIGIPLGLIGLILYGLAIYVAQMAVGLFIGYIILGRFNQPVSSRGMLIAAFALGFILLTLLKLIPFVGFPVWIATVLFGIGAILVSLRKGKSEVSVQSPA